MISLLNSEFLKEGSTIDNFLKPDRIVVGVETEKTEKIMKRRHKFLVLNSHPLIFMDIRSAEMINMLQSQCCQKKISFMNDIANLCGIVGADITNVRRRIGSAPKIGNKFIYLELDMEDFAF